VLKNKYAPIVGTGKTEWDNVYIPDLSDLFTTILEAALDSNKNQNPELFGPKAYFFAANEKPHVWGEVATAVTKTAVEKGYLQELTSKVVDLDDVPDKSWGANSKCVASRAREYFGWSPKGPSLYDEIPEALDTEAEKLGIKKA
jgi:nucleoside-diphosphate-sugar epimerase